MDIKKVNESEIFWSTIKPLFSDKNLQSGNITLIKDGEIISEDEDVAKTFSSFLENAVTSLNIYDNQYLLSNADDVKDPVDAAIKKLEVHSRYLKDQGKSK